MNSRTVPTGRFHPGDETFLSGLRQSELTESTPRASWALLLMLLAVATAFGWAAVAKVDRIIKAEGRVVPVGREQVIASLEGGILGEMLVREGALVEPGQELLRLDPTRVEAQQNEGRAKLLAVKATVARLSAEASGRSPVFPPEVQAVPGLVKNEMASFAARRKSLDEAVGVSRRSLELAQHELQMSERLAAKGLLSEVEILRQRRQTNDLQLQIQERINRFRQDASGELLRAQTELAQLDEQMVVKQDVLRRTTLTSPVRGLVKHIKLGTVGGVVPAGATIMEIVPIERGVLVEARIKPADIGFVHVGLPAEVKLSAYDYYTYGGLKGRIEQLSPDVLGQDNRDGSSDASYYRAVVRADVGSLKAHGQALPVLPGMTATVEIRTGERSVLDFLLLPVMKSQEAFRER
ncbi:HlyD family type I secretion periplasmic adaptor subunit [Aquabacterium sp. A7-Y]|uniref:HlyD family type I secretion periplasmic adaptor subunit n=1 Tax=Aquabacterium sp. A7-Y TaxID=1349605 RepID=UPI00223DCD4C|nr:HlyD family type I secretion periplasmic adaptor subunit [Aquabacterium sp. A7-Y]MCW7541855.1 HlyD family type I secretion periplasmic adaptor subunit [Aquabacterium sp. A7-Y]